MKKSSSAKPALPDYRFQWKSGSDPRSTAAIRKYYNSAPIKALRARMCEIGSRMWQRHYTDGNGGNLSIRVGDNIWLATQTLICKGFMTPDSISMVDKDGRQLAGATPRTSEILTHLAIYRNQPEALATCHAHPPYATAFAITGTAPITGIIPETEVFLGPIGLAEYQTPGTPATAEAVGRAARDHYSILMVNHGVITWGSHIEDAYWKMENTEACCQTFAIAHTLKAPVKRITTTQLRDLINLREKLGMKDPRSKWADKDLLGKALSKRKK